MESADAEGALLAYRLQDLTSEVPGRPARQKLQSATPFLFAAALTLVIAGPWLLPGYIFGTDWAGPRHIDFPNSLTNLAPALAVLAVVAKVLSGELATKLLLVGCLFVAAISAYRALPGGGFVPRSAASLLYVVNPFVYGRLHYGQLFLLAGYAILPWVATRVRLLLMEPDVGTALWLAAGVVVLGVLDLHLLVESVVLVAAVLMAYLVLQRREPGYLLRLARSLLLSVAVALVASTYWLIPLAIGKSPEGVALAHIGTADLGVYSSVADPKLGLLPNLLGLYGFWAEASGRFPSLKLFAPSWPIALIALLSLAIVGAIAVLRSRQGTSWHAQRSWVAGLLLLALLALLLDVGVADPHVAPVIRWLDQVFPPYRGMRDAAKWAAILALVYAQLVPLGVMALLAGVKAQLRRETVREISIALISGLALGLPLYYGNGLLFGMHNQVRPSSYPAGWYEADRILAADPHPGRVLFLPWHLYLSLSFVRNVDSIVANPAPHFFSVPVVTSQNPEILDIPPPDDPDQVALAYLVAQGATIDWAKPLAATNIKYVILAREVDWRAYRYFEYQPNLVLVGDYGSLLLYRNLLSP